MNFRGMLNEASAALGKSQNKDAATNNTHGNAPPTGSSSSNTSTQAKLVDAGLKYFVNKKSHSSKSTEAKVVEAGLKYLGQQQQQQQQQPPTNNAHGAAPATSSSSNALDPKNLTNLASKYLGKGQQQQQPAGDHVTAPTSSGNGSGSGAKKLLGFASKFSKGT
ncbi:hypothetical protein IWW37_004885 [Coemansia sp. RSA 2050]|nr:hypothetical protein IWW37_004885 [Coemansia sp. RSA 2050]KAJ2730816.1 hypothetical protein IW152_004984 [Coemansia sp. BCRC 34962]